jgi:hypothetical protein
MMTVMASPVPAEGTAVGTGDSSGVAVHRVRVTLGQAWCLHTEDSVEVLHVDHLSQIDPAARSWIARRYGVPAEAVRVRLDIVMPSADAWTQRRPAPRWWV